MHMFINVTKVTAANFVFINNDTVNWERIDNCNSY